MNKIFAKIINWLSRSKRLNRLTKILGNIILSKNPWCIPLSEQIERILSPDAEYFTWLVKNKLTDNFFKLMSLFDDKREKIIFSVVMPVYNTDPDLLEKAVLSVTGQLYNGWELLICDDASDSAATHEMLQKLIAMDSRIKLISNRINCGISDSTNSCVEKSNGDFIIFLDHDDELYSDALLKIKNFVERNSDKTIFYSDEDRISPDGFKYRYNFKPAFSPSLLETHNYILHLVCIRKDIFQIAGGLKKEFDGSQDYDLLLRIMDMGEKFVHIPDILYSWRESKTSMIGGSFKPEIFMRGKKALAEHYKRRNEPIEYINDDISDIAGVYRTRFFLPENQRILLVNTGEQNFNFDIYDLPCSMHIDTLTWKKDTGLSLQILDREFDLILFLDGAVVPLVWKEFVRELAAYVLRKDVGVVGGYIVSKDANVLCAGMSLMPWGQMRNDYRGMNRNKIDSEIRICDRMAVSGTALAVSSDVFKIITNGSMVLNNDLDWDIQICLKVQNHGFRVVFNPHAEAVFNRCYDDIFFKEQFFREFDNKYNIKNDPFLNPNIIPGINRKSMDFSLNGQLPEIKQRQGTEDDGWDLFYRQWLKKHSPDFETSKQRIQSMDYHPFFSVIIPTYNSPVKYFKELILALKNQTYQNFEIIISDDASCNENFAAYLKELSEKEPMVQVVFSNKNRGIAENTNRAINMAKGDFIVFCDHDDLMELFALEMIAAYLNSNPHADVIYSDEDKIDESGRRSFPRYQPDWNPDMLLSHMYCPHLVCMKKQLVDKVGKLNCDLDGAQDYDFFLRATEMAQQTGHIDTILYSWRILPQSTAMDAASKVYAFHSGQKALEQALKRRKISGIVVKAPGTSLGVYRVKRNVNVKGYSHIVEINSKQNLNTVKNFISFSSIPVDVVAVVDEKHMEIADILDEIRSVKLVIVKEDVNRSAKYNAGARNAKYDDLIFSADGIDIMDSDYPLALLEHTSRSSIGAAGVKIIYPNGCYYHTGMILGVNGVAGYAHRNTWQDSGYGNFAVCIRNYSAVSWDFIGISRGKLEDAGWFDESLSFYGGVDLCLKMLAKGYKNIYTPYITVVLGRKVHILEELRNFHEESIMIQRYGEYIKNDPMYNKNLSRKLENFSLNI